METSELFDYHNRCFDFLDETWPDSTLHDRSILIGFEREWNWIMRVVKAIEKHDFVVIIATNECIIMSSGDESKFIREIRESKEEATVEAINQFLIWHNQTSLKNKQHEIHGK